MSSAHRFEDLACWQLSVDLRDQVFRLIDDDRVRENEDFHSQTSAAAASAPSLGETRNQLLEGIGHGYWTIDQIRDLLFLQYRARKTTTALLAYLDSCDGTPPAGWDTSGDPPPEA
jgi:hypothetical protein